MILCRLNGESIFLKVGLDRNKLLCTLSYRLTPSIELTQVGLYEYLSCQLVTDGPSKALMQLKLEDIIKYVHLEKKGNEIFESERSPQLHQLAIIILQMKLLHNRILMQSCRYR